MEEMPQQERAHASSQFKGIRKRKWGSWGAEIRIPRSRVKLWLGSYKTAEQAARAFDAAVYCLRGPNSIFNFPESIPSIPSACSLSRHQIQLAAARYATLDELPIISPSEHNNNENANANCNNELKEDPASLSRSASVQERVSWTSGQHQQEHELASCESAFGGSDDCLLIENLERMSSIEEASALNLIPFPSPIWEEQRHEQEDNNFLHLTDLWNFGDI